MTYKIFASFFLFLVLQQSSLAQAPPQCQVHWTTQIWFWGDPPLPSGSLCRSGEGPYSLMCDVPSTKCPVPMVWCPTCGKYVPVAAQPINLTNGNTYIQQQDLRIPGLAGGLSLVRTWNSIVPADYSAQQGGLFGGNWRSTYEERIFTGNGNASDYMVYLRSDGSIWYFSGSGSNWSLASPASSVATLTASGSTWTMKFQNGEQRTFNGTSGSLTSIIDRNGNAKQLSYDGSNRLTGVTDPAGRHLYFNYPDGSSRSVASVTTDFGVALSYLYDAQGRLVRVAKPDQSFITFEYDASSLISAVKDSQGKILESHTYDGKGRGVTASRADGVDAVSISYPN